MFSKSYRRVVKAKNCTQDFGFGPGVLYSDEVTYKDEKGWGFQHPSFLQSKHQDEKELLDGIVEIIVEALD